MATGFVIGTMLGPGVGSVVGMAVGLGIGLIAAVGSTVLENWVNNRINAWSGDAVSDIKGVGHSIAHAASSTWHALTSWL